MRRWMLVCGWVLGLSGLVHADDPRPQKSATLGTVLNEFRLTDYRGKEWSPDDFRDKKVWVVAFLGTQCPLAKLYSPRLQELAKTYESKSVAIIAVDPNDQDSLAEMAAHARKHQWEFPFLKDAGQVLADRLGATRTPEVCVLDSGRRLVYRGRIDDQYGIGYIKDKPHSRDLQSALDQVLAGKDVAIEQPSAVGCLIGRKRSISEGSEITYSNQVSRILQKRCVSCHHEGDIGPMDLTQYEEVAGWSEMILEVIQDQRMPPWHAKEGVGHFSNDRRMPREEIDTIAKWVQAGCPEGNREQLPSAMTFVTGWQLTREPDLVLPMSKRPYTIPATGDVRYQYFRVDPQLTEDKWIESAEIVPGNRAVVHHILVFAREKGSQGDLGGERGFLFGYVPGTRIEPSKPGYAKRLSKNSELIFQVHYTPVGTEQQDLSKIGLVFADPSSITHEVQTTSAVQVQLNIPPNASNYEVSALLPEKLPACQLISMSPHMHLRGKAFRYTALYPDGKEETLLDIPRYDFNWQTEYRVDQLKEFPEGTRIRCEAAYDNSDKNLNNPAPDQWVHWGDQTYEEMMIGYFHVAVPIDPKTGTAPQVLQGRGRNAGASPQAMFERLDRNQDGQLTADEVPDRLKPIIKQMDSNRDGILQRSELSNAPASRGR